MINTLKELSRKRLCYRDLRPGISSRVHSVTSLKQEFHITIPILDLNERRFGLHSVERKALRVNDWSQPLPDVSSPMPVWLVVYHKVI